MSIEFTLEVIMAMKVINKYLVSNKYHSLTIDQMGGVTIEPSGAVSKYVSPIGIDYQMVLSQGARDDSDEDLI